MNAIKRLICRLFGQCSGEVAAELAPLAKRIARLERMLGIERTYWKPRDPFRL
jgi:hypothetical protein